MAFSTVTVLDLALTKQLAKQVQWAGTIHAWKAMVRLTELRLAYEVNRACPLEPYRDIASYLPSSLDKLLLKPLRLGQKPVSVLYTLPT